MRYIVVASFAVILIHCIKTGSSDIVTYPKTYETPIGELAYFNCSTSKIASEIQWFHYPDPKTDRKLVYGFNQFHNVYRSFQMDRVNSTGSWNLVIPSVLIENAGRYECQDDVGRGQKSSAHLIVLDSTELKSHITTNEVIQTNNCGIKSNELTLSCNVLYHGMEAPIYEWKKFGENRPISDGVTNETLSNNRVMYNLTLKGDAIKNGSSYACYATRSAPSKAQYNSNNVIVAGHVVDTSESATGIIIIVIVIILIPLFNALTAAIIWHLFIAKNEEKKEENTISGKCGNSPESPEGGTNVSSDSKKKINEAHGKTDKEATALLANQHEEASKTDLTTVNIEEIKTNENESGTSSTKLGKPTADQLEKRTDSTTTNPEGSLPKPNETKKKFKAGKKPKDRSSKTGSSKSPNEKELSSSSPGPKQQKSTGGSKSRRKFSKDAIIFVLLMAIPFCIGLLLWYLLIYRRTQWKKEKDNVNSRMLMVASLENENLQFRDQLHEEKIKVENLETKLKNLETELKNLETELKNLENKRSAFEQQLYTPVKYADNPELVFTIETRDSSGDKKYINHLAVLGSELFVSHWKSPKIKVYDTVTYLYLRKVQIPEIKQPFDLTAGKTDNCLFVIGMTTAAKEELGREIPKNANKKNTGDQNDDGSSGKKQKIDDVVVLNKGDAKVSETTSMIVRFDTSGKLFDPWPQKSGGFYGQLSTCESNLIVCLLEMNIINEFTKDGVLLHTVRLSPDVGFKSPLHAIKVTSMHYAVTHGGNIDEPHRICVVDLKGNIKKEFEGWGKANTTQDSSLKMPVHFIEDDGRYLLVVDQCHYRIVLFNWELNFQRILIQFEGKEYPARLCFDEAQSKLFVSKIKSRDERGQKNSKRAEDLSVLIYKLK